MKQSDIHSSHEMVYSNYDDHDHDHRDCKTCLLFTCFLCETGEGMYDEELAAACLGYSYWDSMEAAGADGITRTVKKSGTGWPRGKK